MSLVRDVRRLRGLALRHLSAGAVQDTDTTSLDRAAEHVVGFNMAGLHRIENDLFFPWMREKLCGKKSDTKNSTVRDAFRRVLDEIDAERTEIAGMGQAMREQARLASSPASDDLTKSQAASNIARISETLAHLTRSVLDREESLLVPAVAFTVPEGEQRSFNNRVIRKLGVFDSRVHLVGMRDAVWEGGDEGERELFAQAIPSIPRMMIPRWRRNLYEPQVGDLELGE